MAEALFFNWYTVLEVEICFCGSHEESEEAPSFLEYSTEMQCILSESTKHALNATIRVPLDSLSDG